MKDEFKKGIEGIKKIKLESSDKEAVYLRLLENINSKEAISAHRRLREPFKVFSLAISYRFTYALSLFLIVSMVGGSTVFAAEKALPGDLLYTVKIGINEKVVGVLKDTPREVALWESEKASRRLEEAETLAALGKLDTKRMKDLEERFEESASNFKVLLDVADYTSDIELLELQSDFDARVIAHSKILEHIENYVGDDQKVNIRSISEKVREKIEDKLASKSLASSVVAEVATGVMMLGAQESFSAPEPMMLKASPTSRVIDNADLTSSSPVYSEDVMKRREVVEKLINNKEREIEEAEKENNRNELRTNILKDSREALNEARELLNQSDGSVESIIRSERSVKQADISLKQSSKLKTNKSKKD